MTELRPLAIWTERELNGADWARIRGKLKRLNLPYEVQFGRAVAGGPTRVLAIGSEPDFICDYAMVPSTGAASLGEALSFALGENDDPRAVTIPEMLSRVLGGPVREIEDATGTGFGSGSAADSRRGGQRGLRAGEPGPSAHGDERELQPDIRGDHDPHATDDERDYRAALREARRDAAGVG